MPDDGARIRRLAYRQKNLLTPPPRFFTPPRHHDGQYEKRPVYGYDDCFPTVDPCPYPGGNLDLPDHGEACWLKADCFALKSGLKCVFVSRLLPFVFEREMIFDGNCLTWIFTVVNTGRKVLPFIHVMHPLMPVSKVRQVELPAFAEIVDETTGGKLDLKDLARPVAAVKYASRDCHSRSNRESRIPGRARAGRTGIDILDSRFPRLPDKSGQVATCLTTWRGNDTAEKQNKFARKLQVCNVSTVDVEKFLLLSQTGRAHMFLLRGVKDGFFRMFFRGGLSLSVSYDHKIFSTLGIWWNRLGFPAEKGLERDEFAIEPIPGAWSSLKKARESGDCLSVPAGRTFVWRIDWRVNI